MAFAGNSRHSDCDRDRFGPPATFSSCGYGLRDARWILRARLRPRSRSCRCAYPRDRAPLEQRNQPRPESRNRPWHDSEGVACDRPAGRRQGFQYSIRAASRWRLACPGRRQCTGEADDRLVSPARPPIDHWYRLELALEPPASVIRKPEFPHQRNLTRFVNAIPSRRINLAAGQSHPIDRAITRSYLPRSVAVSWRNAFHRYCLRSLLPRFLL